MTEKHRGKQERECAVKIDGVKKRIVGVKAMQQISKDAFESCVFFPTK